MNRRLRCYVISNLSYTTVHSNQYYLVAQRLINDTIDLGPICISLSLVRESYSFSPSKDNLSNMGFYQNMHMFTLNNSSFIKKH